MENVVCEQWKTYKCGKKAEVKLSNGRYDISPMAYRDLTQTDIAELARLCASILDGSADISVTQGVSQ